MVGMEGCGAGVGVVSACFAVVSVTVAAGAGALSVLLFEQPEMYVLMATSARSLNEVFTFVKIVFDVLIG
jgi:hypothetical protein